MIGLALILLPVGYVLVYTGFVGDGNPAGTDGGKTYSLSNAFRNALNGSLLHPGAVAGGSSGGASAAPSGSRGGSTGHPQRPGGESPSGPGR